MLRLASLIILLLVSSCCTLSAFGQAKADTLSKGQKSDTLSLGQKQTQQVLESLLKSIQDTRKATIESETAGSIIIDQTKTRVGKEFFDRFNQSFEIPDIGTDFLIIVDERPSMATTTIITININDLDVYLSYLQPKSELLEESVLEAAETVNQFIRSYQQVLLDMSNKEQQGSGLF